MSWSRRGTENDSLRRQVRLLDELGSPCGLNADWWCRAWHVGGAGQPNGLESGLYVLDTEEPDGILTLVRRGEFDEDTGEVEVDVIAESHDPVTLIALAREIENGNSEEEIGG